MSDIVTLTEGKAFLGISATTDDTILQVTLDSVEDWIAERTGNAFTEATRTDYLDGGELFLWPLVHPVISITSVTDNNDSSTVTGYQLRENVIAYDALASIAWLDGINRFTVVYVAGYGNTQAIPTGLKGCALQLLNRVWDAKGGKKSDDSSGAETEWQDINTSDIEYALRKYDRRRIF